MASNMKIPVGVIAFVLIIVILRIAVIEFDYRDLNDKVVELEEAVVYTYEDINIIDSWIWYSTPRVVPLSGVVHDILVELDMSYEYRGQVCEQDVLVKLSGVTK